MIKVGLVGRGIQGSRSPGMHMGEAAAQGMDLTYVLLDQDAPEVAGRPLGEVIGEVEREGFAGVNVTFPFKQAVMSLLDDLSDDARKLGAVNTIVFHDGRRTGHNTDWYGFGENLRRGLPDAPLGRLLQLGAGGAGSAVAYALLKAGAGRLDIYDVDQVRARELAATMGGLFGTERCGALESLAQAGEYDGLVNTTPMGMAKFPGSPLPVELLRPSQWVADVVYFPIETELLRAARELGCRTLDGGGMAVFQAVEAFRLFTGVTPDAERMRAGFLAAISGEGGAGA
jgi:shikimate dehydrogenase